MSHAELRIVYICGPGHSGSTLADLLIGAHSQAWSGGELKRLSTPRFERHWRAKGMLPVLDDRCTCGAARIRDCSFWRQIDLWLQAHAAPALADLDVDSPDDATFARHNTALYGALAAVSGAPLLVDSSKDIQRLRRLLALTPLCILPILLSRRAEGVVFSNMKLGRSWLPETLEYTCGMLLRQQLLRSRPHYMLQYEQLAAAPETTLRRVMHWLGLQYEPAQLHWAQHPRHLLYGNSMRLRDATPIQLDTAWRTGLSGAQRLAISCIALPARRRWTPLAGLYHGALQAVRARRVGSR